jgi:hypothetical protein
MYFADKTEVKAFALSQKFLNSIFEMYPKIQQKISTDCYKQYRKHIFKPVNDKRKYEIKQLNKRFVYKDILVHEIDQASAKPNNYALNYVPHTEFDLELKTIKIQEKMLEKNIDTNVHLIN